MPQLGFSKLYSFHLPQYFPSVLAHLHCGCLVRTEGFSSLHTNQREMIKLKTLEKARIHLQMNLNINYFKEKELSRILFLKKQKV